MIELPFARVAPVLCIFLIRMGIEGSEMANMNAEQCERDLTEAAAIAQAKNGDPVAFEHLYRLHSGRVYSLCLRMIKNPAEAEDLTQQSFLQLFRKIGTFRGEAGLSTWLHRVTVNIVLMHIRRKKPDESLTINLERHGSENADSIEHDTAAPPKLDEVERLNLKRAVNQLPHGYKKIFLLYDVLGYEHNEIAGLLGCSIGCSKSQLHKARRRLRRLLQGDKAQSETSVVTA